MLLLFAGFIPLIFGADWMVDGAAALAKRLKVPTLVIGLTVVAFGTSAPELVVNLFASATGSTELALGNIVGSNIFNVLMILGLAAIIYPLAVKQSTLWKEIPLALLSAVMVMFMANDGFWEGRAFNEISRIDGFMLLTYFIIFLVYTWSLIKKGKLEEDLEIKNYTILKSIFLIVVGLSGLILGGKLIVDNAVSVARGFGISERIIGVTIVSIGTSLPELVTSVVAARKKQVDIAVGNIVGSNIFNVFLVLGASAILNPIPVQSSSTVDIWVNIGSVVLLFLFVVLSRKKSLGRFHGVIFVTILLAYMAWLVFSPYGVLPLSS